MDSYKSQVSVSSAPSLLERGLKTQLTSPVLTLSIWGDWYHMSLFASNLHVPQCHQQSWQMEGGPFCVPPRGDFKSSSHCSGHSLCIPTSEGIEKVLRWATECLTMTPVLRDSFGTSHWVLCHYTCPYGICWDKLFSALLRWMIFIPWPSVPTFHSSLWSCGWIICLLLKWLE